MCCISIALWSSEPILGVVYDFNRDELFTGVTGVGAWCNDLPISPSGISSPKNAILTTGFPVNRNFSSNSLDIFLQNIINFKKIRLFGSAALSLAYVACGRVDAYLEEDIMLWDVAAGIALIKASNGFIRIENSTRKEWARNIWAGLAFKT